MFGLDGGVGDFFDVAFKFIQVGSKVLSQEEEQQGGRGFVAKKQFNFDSNIPMPRAQLRDMEAPIGMKLPNIQAAARYFATNQAKDTNINSIKAERFRPSRMQTLASKRPTMSISHDASPGVGSARKSRVDRSTFRSRAIS